MDGEENNTEMNIFAPSCPYTPKNKSNMLECNPLVLKGLSNFNETWRHSEKKHILKRGFSYSLYSFLV